MVEKTHENPPERLIVFVHPGIHKGNTILCDMHVSTEYSLNQECLPPNQIQIVLSLCLRFSIRKTLITLWGFHRKLGAPA